MAASRRPLLAFAAVLTAAAAAGPALAWEDVGHRWIGTLGIQTLPASLPAFLRTPEAARDIGEWAREPDRSRGAGRTHDSDRDPGHFADVDDQGKLLGGPTLDHMPVTRAEYEKQLQAGGDGRLEGRLPLLQPDRRLAAAGQGFRLLAGRRLWREGGQGRGPQGLAERGPRPPREAADLRPGLLVALRRRRQPAAARHLPLQRLGQLPEPQELHPGEDPRAVRGRLRRPQPEDRGGQGGHAAPRRLPG